MNQLNDEKRNKKKKKKNWLKNKVNSLSLTLNNVTFITMVGVTEVSILYLIANSIKIDCDYCIFTGNAVPLNKCYRQSKRNTNI